MTNLDFWNGRGESNWSQSDSASNSNQPMWVTITRSIYIRLLKLISGETTLSYYFLITLYLLIDAKF